MKIRDLGCGLLTTLLIAMPIWVVTTAWRGPVYAIGSLFVLLILVFVLAYAGKFFDRRRPD